MVLLSSSRWLLNAFHCDVQEAVIALSNNIQLSNSKGPKCRLQNYAKDFLRDESFLYE